MLRLVPVLLSLILAVTATSPALAAQPPALAQQRLAGVVAKLEKTRSEAVAQRDRADRTIQQAQQIISRARTADNAKALQAGQSALTVARDTKAKAEQKIRRADQAIQRVRSISLTLSGKEAIGGIITDSKGGIQHLPATTQTSVPLNDANAAVLSPGDEIATAADARARLELLDGRVGLDLHGDTHIRLEESPPDTEVVSLIKGKIHLAIDSIETQRQRLEEKLGAFTEDLGTVASADADTLADATQRATAEAYGKLHAMLRKERFEVRTPAAVCAVRGTDFEVTETPEGTQVFVIEGSVELRALNSDQTLLLQAGHVAHVSPDGQISERLSSTLDENQPWWQQD